MTTTDQFQKIPDYYSSQEECTKAKRVKIVSNPRYRDFKQTHFTAGDEEQFEEYRDKTNGDVCIQKISLKNNMFRKDDFSSIIDWAKYQNLNATSVNNTFQYMFNKFKKGTFVKIQNNQLKVFLPFSKKSFVNEWGDKIKIDPKYGTMYNFLQHINKLDNKHYKISVNRFTDNWYANNCLVRSEFPINEGDTNVANMRDMLVTLCANRKIPDIEFFVNRRDFPLIKRNSTEAYDHIFGDNQSLLSHEYDQYSPVLSMVTTDEYADIPIPTGDDWGRIGSQESKFFTGECKTFPSIENFNVKWENKKPTAVFRGASTGCGVTVDSNVRLKLAYLSINTLPDKDGPLLDAGITKWQLRPRKLKNEKYLQTIDVPSLNKLGISLVSFLNPKQQSEYKYLINVDGHVSAFRLSLEMSMGCCILLADSKYKLWFRNMMKPMVDYVPVKADLSDLIEKIQWCRKNDDKCKEIAENARKFYLTYLQKDGALDYLQKLIIDLKKQSGVYLYNEETPLHYQIKFEKKMDVSYPRTTKNITNIGKIPKQSRSFGVLKGLEWIVNMVNDKSVFSEVATKGDNIFSNNAKTVFIQKYNLAGFSFIVKSTTDKVKELENIHESYIGVNSINEIVKYVPNFAYIFGSYDDNTKSNVIMEYIFGQTFDQWIKSDKFNIQDFIFILIQLAFALTIAQKQCGFVHWDLTPWNIMIQELPHPVEFDYMIDTDNVVRINTQIIPVIIDYGKSHVIHKNQHHGFINMFKVSTIQDIVSILLTSLNSVSQRQNLSKNDVNDIIKLANFLSGTKYRHKPFRPTGPVGLSDVQYFFNRAKKYTEMISSDKYELELKTPLDFIKYVKSNFQYKFPYSEVEFPVFRINKGNPRQVFEYVLSSNTNEKIQSFVNIFDSILSCEFPKPINLFFSYYTAQTLEDNVTSVYNLLLKYLATENIAPEQYILIYEKVIKKIKKMYKKQYEEKTEYDIKNDQYNTLEHAPYTEETFLIPDVILNLIEKYKTIKINYGLSAYKLEVEFVLVNQGMFKLSEEHRKYFKKNFQILLSTDSLNILTNTANFFTLYNSSQGLYSKNKKMLDKKLATEKDDSNCEDAKEYILLYNKILKIKH